MPANNVATAIVEIGFTANTGLFFVLDSATDGILNTNKLAAGTGVVASWTDVTPYLMGFTTGRGRQKQLDEFSAGQAGFKFRNLDGRFSPTNLSGPYVSGGVTEVRPGLPIRVRETWAGVTYDVWYGFIDRWEHTVSVSTQVAMTAQVSCSDGFRRLARFEGTASTPVGAGELSGARIARLLDSGGWDGLRDLDDGLTTLQATDLSGNLLQNVQIVATSENGAVYMGADGAVVFENRYARTLETRSAVSQATFGDAGAEVPYVTILPLFDDDLIINRAQNTRVGGTVQVANDVLSQADHGIITHNSDGLLNQTDAEVLAAAGWVVARFKDAEMRIESLTFNPRVNAAVVWPQVLGRKIGDRVTVKHRPAHGDVISQDVFVEGIEHTYDVQGDNYLTTLRFSSASQWAPFFTLDSSTQGVLNTNALAY